MLILTHFQKSIYRFFKATKALITSTELAFFYSYNFYYNNIIVFIIIIIVIIRSQNV